MNKSKKAKLLCVAVSLLVVFSAVLTACGNSSSTPGTSAESTAIQSDSESTATRSETQELPFVKVIWVANKMDAKITDPEPMKFINKKLKEAINAELVINWIDAEYEQKVNLLTASGEKFDLTWGASYANSLARAVSRDAIKPLDEYLQKYGPTVISHTNRWFGEKAWNAVKYKGKIMAIPLQLINIMPGLTGQKETLDKLGIDLKSVTDLRSLEPILEKIKNEVTDKYPLMPFFPLFFKDVNVDDLAVSGIVYDGTEDKIAHYLQIPGIIEDLKLMKKWYDLGYIPKDILTSKAPRDKYVLFPSHGYVNDGEKSSADFKIPCVELEWGYPMTGTSSLLSDLIYLSSTSENPERAMMFLDYAWKESEANVFNPDNIWNVLSYGIKDKHYKMMDSETIEFIPGSGYENVQGQWFCGGSEISNFYHKGFPKSVAAGFWGSAREARQSPLLGFLFDQEPLKAEIAQVNEVWREYVDILAYGVAPDVDTMLSEVVDKMKNAGLDKIIEEINKQISEWKANN